MTKKQFFLFSTVTCLVILAFPEISQATLESSLLGIKSSVTGIILPTVSVIGVALAAISFFTGNPQAKTHAFYAVVGAAIGFGAQIIVDFISQIIH